MTNKVLKTKQSCISWGTEAMVFFISSVLSIKLISKTKWSICKEKSLSLHKMASLVNLENCALHFLNFSRVNTLSKNFSSHAAIAAFGICMSISFLETVGGFRPLWASCLPGGQVSVAWRLLYLPPSIFKYGLILFVFARGVND